MCHSAAFESNNKNAPSNPGIKQLTPQKNSDTLVRNLANHGVGLSLHEEPTEIATWPDPSERRIMGDGLVLTVEPFLSLGAELARDGDDPWTLYSHPKALTVQYEHTVVASRNGPLVLTMPGQ